MNAKELLLKVKALFDAPVVPPVAAPVVPITAATAYKLKDGTDISIEMAGTQIAVGDKVTFKSGIDGVLSMAGEWELEDGTKITTDANGVITMITEITPVTQPDFVAPTTTPTAPVLSIEDRIKAIETRIGAFVTPTPIAGSEMTDVPTTPEGIRALYLKFAVGTAEERLANLELVAKALMEYSFGWQIREAEQRATADQAINIYKEGLATTQVKMGKQDEVIKGLFELVEKLVEQPSADPKTLNGNKKDQFDRMSARDRRLEKMGEAIKAMKTLQ